MTYSKKLQARIDAAFAAKDKDYQPRTRHIEDGHPVFINRLIFEDSPYLLQHAHNPVDWYPWGEEAFSTAHEQNKPVFLSIGYATCHWCHVMEEQSFENIQVADILNHHFISIKVDREQYPDIDQIYMSAVTLLTGHGGWPMSSFLTHEGKPFFGGTYYPPSSFIDLLEKINQAWTNQQPALLDQAEQISATVINANKAQEQAVELGQNTFQTAVNSIMAQYDAEQGGFSPAPKFPNEPLLMLLLRALERQANKPVQDALEHTLSAMACGGIYDQVGGGFHRYATDPHWLVPHFEKMLYNQAYLARIYAQAFIQTGNTFYARITRQTLDYVLREMTTDSGVFYSATDADSEGVEGTFFVWSKTEIEQLLDADDAQFIIDLFGVTEHGNFEGSNIFCLPSNLDHIAETQETSIDELLARLDPLLETLRDYRQQRIPPLTDDKIIVAWNGMLITALAEISATLNEPRYLQAAERAANTLWVKQRTNNSTLWRINLNDKASIPARQDDYAHFTEALLALYDVSGKSSYLQQAESLAEAMLEQFLDADSGALVMGRESLLFSQPKDSYDGALPSGNAIAIRVLSKLANRTGNQSFKQRANLILQAFSGSITRQPGAYAYMIAQQDEMQFGESGYYQYAASGAIKINYCLTQQDQDLQLQININIADDWHINSNIAEQPSQIPTRLQLEKNSGWEISSTTFPKPITKTLDFGTNSLTLFEGDITMNATLVSTIATPVFLVLMTLELQACNQETCLAPETIHLRLYQKHHG
jgi:uncharacterized protein YyaL (SSP411 family)